jgi:hypothetical protein
MNLIETNIVSTLSRLWIESKQYKLGSREQMHRFQGFANILGLVKDDFGEDFMVEMYHATCKNVNEFIGVIPGFVVKALEKRGTKFDIQMYAKPVL